MTVLEAYLDESWGNEDSAFCVGGPIFMPGQARAFDAEWTKFLSGRHPFHMKDRSKKKGFFAGLDDRAADVEVDRACGLLARHRLVYVASWCKLKAVRAHLPKRYCEFNQIYTFCAHYALICAGQWAREDRPGDDISYVFEADHAHWPQLKKHLGKVSNEWPVIRKASRMARYEGSGKGNSCLQAADCFVWHLRNTASRIRRLERGSLIMKKEDLDDIPQWLRNRLMLLGCLGSVKEVYIPPAIFELLKPNLEQYGMDGLKKFASDHADKILDVWKKHEYGFAEATEESARAFEEGEVE